MRRDSLVRRTHDCFTTLGKHSHAQFGQDLFVLQLLGGKRNGYFLDSGASDGISESNTYMLERKFGWTGICVEPNDAYFRQLQRNRSCVCVQCCLFDREGEVPFVEAGGVLGGILEAYDPVLLNNLSERDPSLDQGRHLPTVPRAAVPVSALLEAHGAPTVIDYWSLDTEGAELTILRSFPFNERAFRALTVEHNRLAARAEIHELLSENGYARVRGGRIDDYYAMGPIMRRNPAFR
jgi:FkbM family methyltransferase